MKTSFSLLFTIIIVSVCSLPSTAQDNPQIRLPEGVIARIGKGALGMERPSPRVDGIWTTQSDYGMRKQGKTFPQVECRRNRGLLLYFLRMGQLTLPLQRITRYTCGMEKLASTKSRLLDIQNKLLVQHIRQIVRPSQQAATMGQFGCGMLPQELTKLRSRQTKKA